MVGTKGVFGSRLSRCRRECGHAVSAVDKTDARLLASWGARFELQAAACTKPAAKCGGSVWLPRRAACAARRPAAWFGSHPNTPKFLHRLIADTTHGTNLVLYAFK